MKRLIMYDLDGTLVDTLQDITEAANHLLDHFGLPRRSSMEIRGFIGGGVEELIRRCLGTDDPVRLEEGIAIYRAHYRQHLLDHSRLYPDAQRLLEYFKSRRQAVITNKPNPYSTDILRSLGVAEYFFAIIGGNSGFAIKPDPESMMALMQREQVSPPQTLFIGDSPVDVEAGRRAGTMTVTVTHGFSDEPELRAASPDLIVRGFNELLAVAQQHQW